MEAPLPALFFRLDQAQVFQRLHIRFHPLNLCFGHSPALEVNCQSGQMRGRCLTRFWSGVAIVTAKLLLHQHGAYRRVHLDLLMEFFVVSGTDIIHEIEGPRAAITTSWIERRLYT